jgi:Queuine tRNA-ribosyltransferase
VDQQIRRDYERRKVEAEALGQPVPDMPNKLLNSKLKQFEKRLEVQKRLKNDSIIREHVDMSKSRMRSDPRPIDSSCGCYTCRTFSRAYLHHLIKAKESAAGTLVTIHNVHFMNRLMADIRVGIESNTLDEVEARYVHPRLRDSLRDEKHDLSKGMGM